MIPGKLPRRLRAILAEPRSELRICGELAKHACEGSRVDGVLKDQPVHAMFDDFHRAIFAGNERRQARSHGFDRRQREGIFE